MPASHGRARRLAQVKFLHTVIWFVLAAAVVALPVLAWLCLFKWVFGITGLILLECAALVANNCECPLRNVAAKYTDDRYDGFDLYLPGWLARNTMQIFGTVFFVGELITIFQFLVSM
jgi:hypothetical protein